jgi:hypothetical protein
VKNGVAPTTPLALPVASSQPVFLYGKGIVIRLHSLRGWFDERQRMFFWVKNRSGFFCIWKG